MIPLNLPRRSNIQGFWKLNELSGTRYDETVNKNNLTDNNTVLYAAGKIGNAADFELTTSEYLSATAVASANLNFTSSNFSASFWWKPESLAAGTQPAFLCRGIYNAEGWYVQFRVDVDYIQVMLNTAATNTSFYSNTGLISAGTLYHIGIVRNGTTGYIYVNGIDRTSSSATLVNPVTSSESFYMGSYRSTTHYVDGLLDEVIIWNVALTAAEVLQVKNINAYKYGGRFMPFFMSMREAYERHDKLWTPKGLILPKDLGFQI